MQQQSANLLEQLLPGRAAWVESQQAPTLPIASTPQLEPAPRIHPVNQVGEYRIRGADSDEDLRGILALQQRNQPKALSEEERAREGFLSLEHDMDLLRTMNQPWPHTIATCRDEVVGYALVTLKSFRARLPELEPMFQRLEQVEFGGRPLARSDYFVMGQVCVSAGHRGVGLVSRIYSHQREQMAPHFDYSLTEVARSNPRSLRAHAKSGFLEVDEYRIGEMDWVILLMPLADRSGKELA